MTTRFEWKHGGHHVLLAGSFTAWKAYPLTQSNGVWFVDLPLPTGTHSFKFVVDGEWRVDEDQPKSGKQPHINNVVHVTKGVAKKKDTTTRAGGPLLSRVGQTVVVENSEDCVKALQEGAAVNFGEVLERLYLSAALLNEQHGNLIVKALKSKNSLTTLNLSHNKLGDAFLKNLSPLLNSTSLKELYLWSTDITDAGIVHLSKSLANNTTLTALQLRGNRIGPEGARSLAQALKTNKTLEFLDLWSNPIGEGLENIAQAIGSHGSLKEVHLGEGEPVKKKSTRDELIKALKVNKSLEAVHLFTTDRRPFKDTLMELEGTKEK